MEAENSLPYGKRNGFDTREGYAPRNCLLSPMAPALRDFTPWPAPFSPLVGGKGGAQKGALGHSGTQALWRDARIILLLWLSLSGNVRFRRNPIEPCVPAHGRLEEAIGIHATVAGRP